MSWVYSAPNTKIKAMIPSLLKDRDYDELLSKKSVKEIVEYLKRDTAYSEVLKEVVPEQIHRGKLEAIFKQSQVDDYIKLIHYFSGYSKEFIKLLLVRYEIEDLKILLRGIEAEKDPDKMRAAFIYLGQYSKVDYDELAKSRSIGDLIDSLKDTIYYSILQSAYPHYEETHNLFHMEMNLDLSYFRMIKKMIKKLSMDDNKILSKLIGMQVDLFNIIWIYRCKTYYELAPEQILNYTIDLYYSLDLQVVKEMCQAVSIEELEKTVQKTSYRKIFEEKKFEEILQGRAVQQYFYQTFHKAMKRGQLNLGTVLSYFKLKEYEIRDLITLIEMVRYENPPEIGRQYLIRQQRG